MGRFNFSQQYLDYGYKELTIAAGPGGTHSLEPNALHIWPRGSYMLIALPNVDGTFACILFLPFEGSHSFASLDTAEKARGILSETTFRCRAADAATERKLLRQSDRLDGHDSMFALACGRKGAVAGRCGSRHRSVFRPGHELRVSKTARASWNFSICMDPIGRNCFAEFERARKANTDAIADLALENFVEMRDRVADPRFLFRKKVELALQAKYPRLFVPKYAMVTFHRVPYSVAHSRGQDSGSPLDGIVRFGQPNRGPGLAKGGNVDSREPHSAGGSLSGRLKFETTKDFAPAMTASDPLAGYRERFHIPRPGGR